MDPITRPRIAPIAVLLSALLVLGMAACKKASTPAAPPVPVSTETPCGWPSQTCTPTDSMTPTATSTITPTLTPTGTPTVTHTPTSTLSAWCPGPGGATGNSSGPDSAIMNQLYTFSTRATLGASVSITALRVYGSNTGMEQQAGVFSDDGTGADPVSLLSSAVYTNDLDGWITVDIPDIPAGPGHVWLAIAANGDHNILNHMCNGCDGETRVFPGVMPASVPSHADHPHDLAILAEWVCP